MAELEIDGNVARGGRDSAGDPPGSRGPRCAGLRPGRSSSNTKLGRSAMAGSQSHRTFATSERNSSFWHPTNCKGPAGYLRYWPDPQQTPWQSSCIGWPIAVRSIVTRRVRTLGVQKPQGSIRLSCHNSAIEPDVALQRWETLIWSGGPFLQVSLMGLWTLPDSTSQVSPGSPTRQGQEITALRKGLTRWLA
jgi:hypothetical protein